MKTCPFCAEEIQDAAIVCRFCRADLVANTPAAQAPAPTVIVQAPAQTWSPGVAAVLSLVIPGAGQMYKGEVGGGIAFLILTTLGYVCFIVPGVLLHIIAIVNAASGSPTPRTVSPAAAAAVPFEPPHPQLTDRQSANINRAVKIGVWGFLILCVVAVVVALGVQQYQQMTKRERLATVVAARQRAEATAQLTVNVFAGTFGFFAENLTKRMWLECEITAPGGYRVELGTLKASGSSREAAYGAFTTTSGKTVDAAIAKAWPAKSLSMTCLDERSRLRVTAK